MKRLKARQVYKLPEGSEVLIIVRAVKTRGPDELAAVDGGPVWYVDESEDDFEGVDYFLIKKAKK